MNIGHRLDELCDEMEIKAKKFDRLRLGLEDLRSSIDALDLMDGRINEKDRIHQVRELLYAMYDDTRDDMNAVSRRLDELGVEFDRLVDEYFKTTGNYYYPERDEWPAWSSVEPSWMKASK